MCIRDSPGYARRSWPIRSCAYRQWSADEAAVHDLARSASPVSYTHLDVYKRQLLYYTYSISGVTYETAQDVTGLEERLHLTRVAAGQTASVKYDPSNPSNSILLADDWSGLH